MYPDLPEKLWFVRHSDEAPKTEDAFMARSAEQAAEKYANTWDADSMLVAGGDEIMDLVVTRADGTAAYRLRVTGELIPVYNATVTEHLS